MSRLTIGFVLASLIFAAPRPAAAALLTTTFDFVDAVEITGDPATGLVVTGIPTGSTAPSTITFFFFQPDVAARCERFAVIAMSKPGKYKFAIGSKTGSEGGCKLILVTP